MGRVKDMYMLMRLSYDQAEGDLADKKTDNIVESYKKYHIENLGHESLCPEEEVRMFNSEDFNEQFNVM
tara:strand:+ start:280 stop:486 length:207 start_codon:yes stop_codon:yes gene_type:complete